MVVHKESKIYKTFLLSICLTTALCLSAVFIWMSARTRNLIYEQLLFRARAQFDTIVLAREWNSHYGGVYVEKNEGITSNPYLENPDIITTDNKVYTNIIPAQMTREMSDISRSNGKFLVHITSLNPVNPVNKPDLFEQKALAQFTTGIKELSVIEEKEDRSYYRYMAPLNVTKDCLRCHEKHGYRLGDVRGGISVSFDIEDLHQKLKTNNQLIFFFAATTTVTLLAVLWYFTVRLIKKLVEARRKIEELAITDGLTKLYNRRHLIERFEEEFERGKRLGEELGCIMFDIDHFKHVNDEYGHQTGDEVLKRISAITSDCIRAYDIAGRFGGEEFIIVLPETGYPSCTNLAERLRKLVQEEAFPLADGSATVEVTISLGIAVLRQEDCSVNDIIKRADEALYQAKSGGRNRVCTLEG